MKKTKKVKVRNFVHLAMMKSKRCSVHGKTNKQLRRKYNSTQKDIYDDV